MVSAVGSECPTLEGSDAGFAVGVSGDKVLPPPVFFPFLFPHCGLPPQQQVIVEQLQHDESCVAALAEAGAYLACPAEVTHAHVSKTRTRKSLDRTIQFLFRFSLLPHWVWQTKSA